MGEAPLLGGRYRLGARIGRGGMADVHRAMDTRLQRVVAAKVFRSGADAAGRERFAEEARILAGLSHPGLVTVHDFSADADELYLIMELVEGHTLADEVQAGPLPPQRVAEIGSRLADVLAHVHANGVVHRDVKPSNVLISDEGGVYLADFGISRLAAAAGRITGSGQLIGTATYMSPEQVSGGEVGYPADVYALGLVLLESVTGRVEYPGSGAESAVARLVRAPEVPLDLPIGLHRALLVMTASDPAKRPTAAECVDLLAGRSTDVIPRVQATPPHQATHPLPRPRRHLKPWLLTGAGIGALLVVLVALLVTPSAPEQPALPPVSGPAGVERLPEDIATLEELIQR